MFIPKKYGQSKIDECPFCGRHATIMNRQDVPVCQNHKNESLDELKCVCGETLEMLHGKFGVFFKCINCGNKNLKKVLEFNTVKPRIADNKEINANKSNEFKIKTTTTVRSDDPRYFG